MLPHVGLKMLFYGVSLQVPSIITLMHTFYQFILFNLLSLEIMAQLIATNLYRGLIVHNLAV